MNNCFPFARSAEANRRLGDSEARLHFCFREAPGSLCEPSGEGLGKLCRSLWMELKGSWEAPGEAPGVGLGKLCCSLLEGTKGYWEALWEDPEKLWRSLLERVAGLLGGSCGAGPTAFWERIAWQRVEYATCTWHILSCFEQHPCKGYMPRVLRCWRGRRVLEETLEVWCSLFAVTRSAQGVGEIQEHLYLQIMIFWKTIPLEEIQI